MIVICAYSDNQAQGYLVLTGLASRTDVVVASNVATLRRRLPAGVTYTVRTLPPFMRRPDAQEIVDFLRQRSTEVPQQRAQEQRQVPSATVR